MTALTDWEASVGKVVMCLQDIKLFAVGSTYTTHRTTALSGVVPDAAPGPQQLLANLHSALYGLQAFGPGAIAAFIPALGRIQGYAETDAQTILFRFFEFAGTTPITVKSRAGSFGSISAGGSNIGNGSVVRLVKDRYGYDIETFSPEAKAWTCVADEHSGAQRWNESFVYRGAAVNQTTWPFQGQGGVAGINAISIRNSEQYIRNPGFETYDATSKFTGWLSTVDGATMTNWTQDTTRYYKDVLPGSTTPGAAIQAAGTTDFLYQSWSASPGAVWNPYVPLYAQVAYMRRASATGTLSLQIGDTAVTVDISTKTNDRWNVLRWPAATPTSAAWFLNWNNTNAGNSTNPLVKVGVTSLATGTCLIDDLICAPYSRAPDGLWHVIVPGPSAENATTAGPSVAFLKDDTFTATDSAGAVAIIEEALARYLGYYLPGVTDASESWVEPT